MAYSKNPEKRDEQRKKERERYHADRERIRALKKVPSYFEATGPSRKIENLNDSREPIIRKVVITEQINPDGKRGILSVESTCCSDSGQPLKDEVARQAARHYLKNFEWDQFSMIWGNPDRASVYGIFQEWPGADAPSGEEHEPLVVPLSPQHSMK